MRQDMQSQGRETERGFTLIEVLIASVLFAVGMIAAMAMQYTALGGYTSSRDTTNATQVGERVMQVIKAESQKWRGLNDIGSISNGVYQKSGSGYWDKASLLSAMDGSPWTWQAVFTQPVDARLSDAGARQYCAYVRGEEITDSSLSTPGGQTGIFRVQVAVVYPGPNGAFPNVASGKPFGECDDSSITNNLNPPSSPSTVPQLELDGYRVVHMGATVVQRRFLDFWG